VMKPESVVESSGMRLPLHVNGTRKGTNGRRPRLLVLNQYYWPGVEATAHLLAELCGELAKTYDVTVVTGLLRDRALSPGESFHDGVRIVRVRSTAFERVRLLPRAINYLTYLIQSFRMAAIQPRPDVVLCMTDPPIIGNVALIVARRFRAPLVVVSQDVFPEIAVQLGRLKSPVLVGLLRLLVRAYLRRADRVVAIGEVMRDRLEAKGTDPSRIVVISNWANTESLMPMPRDNEWAEQHGLVGKFVVMHSGNVGHAQDLDNLVRAGSFLRDLDDLVLVVIGSGARQHDVESLADRLEVDSVKFLPYQTREVLSQSLSAADIHYVGLAGGLGGYIVPSRYYGILAVGRPVIVAADAETETAYATLANGAGVVIPPGRPDLLAGVIRTAYAGELPLDEMGARARVYVTEAASREVALSRYRELLIAVTT
jgi:colanic acid biosynthesis glycosyl transferase WcaI